MNLCWSGHDEICFETNICPLCETMKNKNEEIEHIEELLQEIKR